MTNRCRKCDKVGERIEHVTAGCSSLSESAYLGSRNKKAKTVHQQIARKCKLLDGNTAPYCRYKPEPVMESSNMILCRDRSVIIDKTIDSTDLIYYSVHR
jgi:hypothetical protein